MAMEKQNETPSRTYHFHGSVGQFIEHVDTVNFSLDGDGNFKFENVGQMNGLPKALQPEPPKIKEKKATKEMMSRAALLTLDGGYWKSQRSWSVTYEIYCIWGYKGLINDFLIEANSWPDGVADRMTCNRDAVEKLRNKYVFSKDVSEWRANGIPEPYCILGEHLETELQRMAASEGA